MADILADVQNSHDARGVDIQRVGVKDVHLPFMLRMKDGGEQPTQATVGVSVNLPHNFRGTHMSRFVEILESWRDKPLAGTEIHLMAEEVRAKLHAVEAQVIMGFKCFLPKPAPVTRMAAVMDYDCSFSGTVGPEGFRFELGVGVPFTSLCPCSKSISRFGAHNQRAVIRASISCLPGRFVWIEDLVALLEDQTCCPVYPLLKRSDERYVTERAYENPKFVEDVLRDCVVALRAHPLVRTFDLECESFESIHNHSAFAKHQEV